MDAILPIKLSKKLTAQNVTDMKERGIRVVNFSGDGDYAICRDEDHESYVKNNCPIFNDYYYGEGYEGF